MMQRRWSMLAMIEVLAAAPAPALAGFACPAADPGASEARAALSDKDLAGVNGTINQALRATIGRMKAQGVGNGAIVDRLVVADCGRVAGDASLSDDGKAEQVRSYASRLASVVYATPGQSEEDIVLDLAVPTPVFDRLQQAARAAGLSDAAWVRQAITARLGKP